MNSDLVGVCIIFLRKMNTSLRAQYNKELPPWLQECESSNSSLGFVAVKANFIFTERNWNIFFVFWQLYYAFSVICPSHCLPYLGNLLNFQSMSLFLKRVIIISLFHSVFVRFSLDELNQLCFFCRNLNMFHVWWNFEC